MPGKVSLFPITGWEARPITGYEAVVIRFQYVSSPEQPREAPHTGPLLALTREQTHELIEALQNQLHQLDRIEEFQSDSVH